MPVAAKAYLNHLLYSYRHALRPHPFQSKHVGATKCSLPSPDCTTATAYRFLTPTLFYTAKWLVSLQFLFQAWYLTGPTCAAIEATSYGAQAARKLSSLLDAFAGTALGSCPTHSCYHSQYMLQLTTGATLLYAHYRMERANRLAFLQSKGLKAVHYWPFVPAMVGFVLHVVVYVQVLAAVWVFLQCSIAAM
eukprot:GHUV01020586.1.p1 GENE.GHUV01020586.1~~GHUV01020586.1.p1  ORF type:complete len:192 (+),score=19.71 GHUV01020586.1:1620-2195(+)